MIASVHSNILVREGEGLTIEHKERFTPRIVEDIVAFANARGGTNLLGVRDNGTVVGQKLDNGLKARIQDLARNCSPSIEVTARQNGEVIEISVPEGTEKPYGCSAGYFRRLDAATQKMSDKELRVMFQNHGGIPFEERICRSASLKDLSSSKIHAFMERALIQETFSINANWSASGSATQRESIFSTAPMIRET
jgi:ATP-dependent DNA helicase RecG